MKKNLLILIFSILFYTTSFAQAQLSPATKRFLFDYKNELKVLHKSSFPLSPGFIDEYALYAKSNQYYIGALLWVQPELVDLTILKSLGLRQIKKAGNVYSIRLPIQNLEVLSSLKGIKLIDIGDCHTPDLKDVLRSTRADSAHRGLGDLTAAYSGKNVVVAIIDWGFDYTHPMFYDSTLANYRVVRAWDQNKMAGTPPAGYDFGTAYESKEALLAAKEDTLYVFGPGSHGTHVAGIAGGAGARTPHIGVTLNSDLIFISLRRDAPSLIDAYSYIESYAKSVKKPFVINMSFGNHLGPHDGTTLENIGIDAFAGKGKIIVASAGNNGTNNFHIKHNFSNEKDTLKTVVSFTAMTNYFGQTLSMWGSANSSFSVRFHLVNPDNTTALSSKWYQSEQEPVLTDFYGALNGDSVEIRITATAAFATNNKPNIRAEIRKKGNLRLLMEVVSNDKSEVHIWNVIRLTNRVTNWGMNLTSNYPGAVAGDRNYGLGEPGGVGKNVLTIASYRAELYRTNGSIGFGQLSGFSSIGPTVDGRRKPDVAGPGQEVISSVNSWDPNPKVVAASTVFNGRTYEFEAYSGTSMSGPAVAGIVALLLEKNPSLNHTQIKEIIQKTSRLDIHTGNIHKDTSALDWGSGKANVLEALYEVSNYPVEQASNLKNFYIYPNPSNGMATFTIGADASLKVFDLSGRIVFENKFVESLEPYQLDLQFVKNGIYFFQFQSSNGVSTQKWLKVGY